jgi:two-component system, OmpR family, response regulator
MLELMKVADAKDAFQGVPEVEVKSALPGWICLSIAPELEVKRRVVDFFRSQMSDLPADLCEEVCLALDELLGNAIEHGCKIKPNCPCELTSIRTLRMIFIHVRDSGFGFDWSAITHAAVNNPSEDHLRHLQLRSEKGMRPGGFGILLVKQLADELIYNESGNEVAFVKYL